MTLNAQIRARRRRRFESDFESEFQVAPMIDVLLVLTLFFMSITSTELLKKEKILTLPFAPDIRPTEDPHQGEIVINVAWSHGSTAEFSINGMDYPDANSLRSYLASRVASEPGSFALVRADKDVEYSNVADVMASCAAAGISKVKFAIVTTGNHGRPSANPR